MPRHWSTVLGVGVIAALGVGTPAWATLENLKTFKQVYPAKDTKGYSCKVCHLGAIGKKGELNAYGLVLQTLKAPGNAKQLTEQDLRAVEKTDADGDGASNLTEITAGTDPGDSTSVPK